MTVETDPREPTPQHTDEPSDATAPDTGRAPAPDDPGAGRTRARSRSRASAADAEAAPAASATSNPDTDPAGADAGDEVTDEPPPSKRTAKKATTRRSAAKKTTRKAATSTDAEDTGDTGDTGDAEGSAEPGSTTATEATATTSTRTSGKKTAKTAAKTAAKATAKKTAKTAAKATAKKTAKTAAKATAKRTAKTAAGATSRKKTAASATAEASARPTDADAPGPEQPDTPVPTESEPTPSAGTTRSTAAVLPVDEQGDGAGGDAPSAGAVSSDAPDDAPAQAPRARARTSAASARRRSSVGTGQGDEPPAAPAEDAPTQPAADDADAASSSAEVSPVPSGDEGSATEPRKRRRRGRRGRGRGRGRSGGTGGAGTDGGADGSPEADTQRDRSSRAARSSDDTGDAAAGADDAGPDAGASRIGGEPDDRDLQAAIAREGTRVAAKRGRRPAGGGTGTSGRAGRGRAAQRTGGVPEEVRRAILEGPPRTMLVTSLAERTQIAVLEDRTVVEHYVTRRDDITYVGNIYMARVQNVLPGMEAAFLDIGKGRNGVLYAGEVLYDELDLEEGADERIENALKPGQKVLVQVTKDPMGSKGPRLTMHLSLAGRYMVLAPGSDLFGISRKLTDRERDRLRRVVKQVKPPEHGVIVRTAAEGATDEQLRADLERLLGKWDRVTAAAEGAKALTAVYEEPPLVVKVIRDNFGPEFERCIVDDDDLYHQVRDYLAEVAPELLDKVELYGAPTADARARAVGAPPLEGRRVASEASDEDIAAARTRRGELPALFDAYDVTDQLRKALGRKVWLPSGGYLIIESTEAMKVIDVNTGRFTGGADTNLEEVVLKTNLEAADEIVRQLRLRDMGGIIIIDFIDMLLKTNQDQVVRRLKRELLRDRTKTRVSEVSRLGLVQMTRKNVSQGLIESFSHSCSHCEGRGLVTELS